MEWLCFISIGVPGWLLSVANGPSLVIYGSLGGKSSLEFKKEGVLVWIFLTYMYIYGFWKDHV